MAAGPASWLSPAGTVPTGIVGSSVRLRVQIFLRWLAVIGQLGAVLVVGFGL